MRDCKELLDFMKEKNMDEILNFVKEKATSINDKTGIPDYYIGIRDNCFNLYYLGQSLVKVYPKKNNILFKTGKAFRTDEMRDEQTFKAFCCSFDTIKSKIEMVSKGSNDQGKKDYREKRKQQEIVSYINKNSHKWYCVDMEYNQEGTRIGRFDIIAISRNPDGNNKHRVALIELKVGKESYSGSPVWPEDSKDREQYATQLELVFNQEDGLFSPASLPLRYGSGIVSHIADFLRYLPANENQPLSYQTMLSEEIPKIIKSQKQLGCPVPKELVTIEKENLETNPEVVFLCYTNSDLKEETISDLKDQLGKYIFSSVKFGRNVPKYPLERTINNLNVSSFLSKDFAGFLKEKNPGNSFFTLKQDIKGKSYPFSFAFVDSNEKESLGYLDELL